MRIAQMIVAPLSRVRWSEVSKLSETAELNPDLVQQVLGANFKTYFADFYLSISSLKTL